VENITYSPKDHPLGYYFNVDKGRILNEYLLYITNGNGVFTFSNNKQSDLITERKKFFLMPGVWHTYKPLENSGWNEYWIGFKGDIIEKIVSEGFFLNRALVFNIGLNERIIDLYMKAIVIANEERAGYQQAHSGIVMHILGLMYYRDKTPDFEDEDLINKINKAKVVMRESVYKNITAEEIAKSLNICYSGFRRAFKEFTGTSPSKYMVELKLNEAKLLLSTTSQSVKQIANTLNFDNLDYFPVFF
jgi:AraC-like DNA-binding protein